LALSTTNIWHLEHVQRDTEGTNSPGSSSKIEIEILDLQSPSLPLSAGNGKVDNFDFETSNILTPAESPDMPTVITFFSD
jgi:hypothetical protein